MKHIINKIISMGSAVAVSAITLTAKAQGTLPPYVPKTGLQDKSNITAVLTNIANFFGTFVIAISVLTLLYAGFKFLTAGENEDSISAARRMITWGIVGIVVALLAFSVAPIVGSFLQ